MAIDITAVKTAINGVKTRINNCFTLCDDKGSTYEQAANTTAELYNKIQACKAASELFIYPPYEFKVVDNLITNFHLPKSTLLMLVSALASKEFIFEAYKEAIKNKYRFYSYCDCMLIS